MSVFEIGFLCANTKWVQGTKEELEVRLAGVKTVAIPLYDHYCEDDTEGGVGCASILSSLLE